MYVHTCAHHKGREQSACGSWRSTTSYRALLSFILEIMIKMHHFSLQTLLPWTPLCFLSNSWPLILLVVTWIWIYTYTFLNITAQSVEC